MLAVIAFRLEQAIITLGLIVSRLVDVSSILSNLSNFINNLQLPNFISTTNTTLTSIQNNLNSIGIAQNEQFKALQDQLNALSAKVGNPLQQGQSVVLPRIPPAGYGAPPGGVTADAVWNYRKFAFSDQAWQYLTEGAQNAVNKETAQVSQFVAGKPFYRILGTDATLLGGAPNFFSAPNLDITTILPSDATVFAWVTRVYNTYNWFNDGFGQPAVNDSVSAHIWVVTMTPLEFAQAKGAIGTGAAVVVPPVWPGLAGVTLGTPVALSPSFEIVGPLHGVLINMTSVNPKKATADIHGSITHRNVGICVFVSDHGEAETFQVLGFMHHLFMPKSMSRAARVRFNLDPDDVGTATPFTIP